MQHRKSLGIVMTVVLGMTCAGHSSSLADVAQKRRPAVLRAAIPVLSILKDGMKQWLNGATVQESLGAWEVVGAERAHASLKSAGVKSIELIGMEFELILMRDKQPVYYVRSFISANRRGPKLMHLTGASGAPFVKGHPLEAWTGPTTPLRTAAYSFMSDLQRTKPYLSFIDDEQLRGLVPEAALKKAIKRLGDSRAARPGVRRDIQALNHDSMHLRLDDVAYAAYNAKGKLIGMMPGSITLVAGKPTLTLQPFRAN